MPYVDHHILTPREVYNANHWRRRAKLTLDKAKSIEDPRLKARLVRVATEYQKLAKCVDNVESELRRDVASTRTALGGLNLREPV